jgi:hypothetical protein
MTITRLSATLLAVAVFLGSDNDTVLCARQPATSGLTLAEFEKLHKELQPPKDELWRTIPWHVSILEGREAAAKSGKPIFVWVASGEPLGCG